MMINYDGVSAMKPACRRKEEGYVMLGVIMLVALTLLVTAGMLESSSSNSKTRALVTTQAKNYYEVEESINRVVGWLQANSKNMARAFLAENYETVNFTTTAPTIGSNEAEQFHVPTMVKIKGTNQSVMLSNNDFFGTPAFPVTTNIDTGASFDAVDAFRHADLGTPNARILLVWARETAGAYEPVFRIDVITGNHPDRGVHSFSYVYANVVPGGTGSGGAFYGKYDFHMQSASCECRSKRYTYSGGAWTMGGDGNYCEVATNGIDDGVMYIHGKVYGYAKTLIPDGIQIQSPGNVSSRCEGSSCHSYSITPFATWASTCPGTALGTDISIGNGTLPTGNWRDVTVTGTATIPPGCYRKITINNQKQAILSGTDAPYNIQKLVWGGNNAKLSFGAIPETPVEKVVTLNVEFLDGQGGNANRSALEGGKTINSNNAPHQLVVNYTGTLPLDIGGNVSIGANVTAPSADVTVIGTAAFFGSIKAQRLTVSGNGNLYYDEALGVVSPISDINYELKKTSQRYR
jgi:hypothetical protein